MDEDDTVKYQDESESEIDSESESDSAEASGHESDGAQQQVTRVSNLEGTAVSRPDGPAMRLPRSTYGDAQATTNAIPELPPGAVMRPGGPAMRLTRRDTPLESDEEGDKGVQEEPEEDTEPKTPSDGGYGWANEQEDATGNNTPARSIPASKKKSKRPPMSASEEEEQIRLLKAKLQEFPTTPPKEESKTSAKHSPQKGAVTSPESSPDKKRKREPKVKKTSSPKKQKQARTPKREYTPKRPHKEIMDALKSGQTPRTRWLVELLTKLGPNSSGKDIDNIMEVARRILKAKEDPEDELGKLSAQEDHWKAMVLCKDVKLKDTVNEWLQHYGVIPFGAVEAAEEEAAASQAAQS